MERIVEFRIKQKLTQKELAQRLGTYQEEISRLENEKITELTARQKFLFLRAFPGISLDWLETGKGDIFITETAPPDVPSEFAYSQGLGRNTAQAFERLCRLPQEQKDAIESIVTDERIRAIAAVLFGK